MSSAAPEPIRDVVILRIAEGGMGYIELVARRQGRFSRLFARKRLHPHLRGDASFRAMFLDEARLAGLIRHPNVAAALEVGEDGDGPFLLMDYVDGPSVAEIIARVQPRDRLLPVALCVSIAAQAARGLHAAHQLASADGTPLGIVHRDISPKNLLVGYDGLVRVADFGIAKARDNVDQTRVGVLKGNVGYMAPEYLRFQDIDCRSDLFALGVVLHEMLTRERLYRGEDTAAVARRIVDEPPQDIFDVRDVPPELAALLFELMAKDRDLRPPDGQAVATLLDGIAAGLAAVEGPFDVAAFLAAELAPMRDERQALVGAAMAPPAGDGHPSPTAELSATPTPRREPGRRRRGRAVLAAGLLAGAAVMVAFVAHRTVFKASPGRGVALSPGAAALWSGGWHACALRGDELMCWGSNIRGQLGDGTQLARDAPIPVALDGVRALALGEYHSCAAVAGGRVLCWGRNVRGEIGRAAPTLSKAPLEVPGLAAATALASGRQHTCALLALGAVSCWGANESGQLGRPPSPGAEPPAVIAGLPPVERLFAGGSNTCATRAGGELLCWGANESGQLGDGTRTARATPAPVAGIGPVVALAIGNSAKAGSKNPDLDKSAGFMCAVTRGGAVLCWGNNNTAQLGDGTRTDRPSPTAVQGVSDAIAVAAGDLHACALRRSGRVSCWGRNEFGAVGDGTMGPSTVRLTAVDAAGVEDAVGLALGGAHSCARRRDGGILCWGVNNFGQLGDRSAALHPLPHPVGVFP